jgi:hypothetical protein
VYCGCSIAGIGATVCAPATSTQRCGVGTFVHGVALYAGQGATTHQPV